MYKWFRLQHSSAQYQKSVDFLMFSLVAILDSLNRWPKFVKINVPLGCLLHD